MIPFGAVEEDRAGSSIEESLAAAARPLPTLPTRGRA